MLEPKQILNEAEELMESAVMYLDDALARIRAGKASARILDVVKVEYYGQMSPLSNVATITTPDARTIQIQPWEKKMLSDIERALINSSIGLAPNNNGECIRLMIPPLTEERRKELTKQVKKYAEDAKVAMRNVRRDGMDYVKKLKKNGEITEDDQKKAEKDLQDLLDKNIKKVDAATAAKEKELMAI